MVRLEAGHDPATPRDVREAIMLNGKCITGIWRSQAQFLPSREYKTSFCVL